MSLSHHYADLDQPFALATRARVASSPRMLYFNEPLANELQLDATVNGFAMETLADYFSGKEAIKGSKPVAMAYAGHQFGNFVPQLGDGRALLLGESRDTEGLDWDLHLKGAGPTAFSRGGDGLYALGPAVRECVMSEIMYRLNVPTSRCLALLASGDPVYRDSVQPGAILTRVARSHIRVGSFQYIAANGNLEQLNGLLNFTGKRLLTNWESCELEDSRGSSANARKLFDWVMARQIELVVHWMRVGFVHGVLNTDNTALSGETIDYGPCAMMNHYDPTTVFSSIDRHGRYAFAKQASIIHWNLTRLAECILPLIDTSEDRAVEIIVEHLNRYESLYLSAYHQMMANKLGLGEGHASTGSLISEILAKMHSEKLDYTNTFVKLTALAQARESRRSEACYGQLQAQLEDKFGNTMGLWLKALDKAGEISPRIDDMKKANPSEIPRNSQVEGYIAEVLASVQAEENAHGDLNEVIHRLSTVIEQFGETCNDTNGNENLDKGKYSLESALALPWQVEDLPNFKTFCGT